MHRSNRETRNMVIAVPDVVMKITTVGTRKVVQIATEAARFLQVVSTHISTGTILVVCLATVVMLHGMSMVATDMTAVAHQLMAATTLLM